MTKNILTGLVIATKIEAEPFIKGMSLKEIRNKPFRVYRDGNIILIISGVGKSNAAIATTYLILEYKTECMFNLGSSGSTTKKKKLGEIYHIDSIVEYDRPNIVDGGLIIKKPNILEGFETTSLSTQDRPIISTSERQAVSKYAELVDMEGASFRRACKLLRKDSYLFKIVSDTPEHDVTEIIENIRNVSATLFDFFYESVYNKNVNQ